MEKLKVAFIVDKCAPWFVGGYESRVLNLARQLGKRHEVRVYTSLSKLEETIEGFTAIRLTTTAFQEHSPSDRSFAHSALFAASLIRTPFRDWTPDVVLVEAIPFLHLPIMRRWIRSGRFVSILNVNEAWDAYTYKRGIAAAPTSSVIHHLLREGIKWANLTITISGATAESLRRHYGVENPTIIPMGVDLDLVSRGAPRSSVQQRYDFVTMHRLVPHKRTVDFLVALSILRSNFNWRGKACIIGDGPLRRWLVDRSRQLGIASQVDFLGFLPDLSKYATLKSSRIFVHPSEREGFSMATLEALACGLPVVVAVPEFQEVFGASDFVSDGRNGIYYGLGDSSQLANNLHKLLESDDMWSQMGRTALETASHYSWSRACDSLETLIRTARTG